MFLEHEKILVRNEVWLLVLEEYKGHKHFFFPSNLTKTNVGIATCLPFCESDYCIGS